MSIGKNMQRLRAARNWTQRETAKKLFLEKSIYSRYESDTVVPSVDILMSIANLFGVSLDELTDFVPDTGNRVNRFDLAMYRLKEMGISFKMTDDIVVFDIYGQEYKVNVSDLSSVVDKSDKQYSTMLIDINKGLYIAALALVLGNVDEYHYARKENISIISRWAEKHKEKITPIFVMEWLREDLILLPMSDRKRIWDKVVRVLRNEGYIKEDEEDRWECPFVSDDEAGK